MTLSNSHQGAAVVWDTMCQEYLALPPFLFLTHSDNLWPLWKKKHIPKYHRTVLMMTYDNAIILQKDYARAAEDIKQFIKDFPETRRSHFNSILNMFNKLPNSPAIGFWWTSVNENPFIGKWNKETQKPYEFEWTRLWDMYEKFDSFEAQ